MVRTETVEEEYTPNGKTEAVKTKRTYIRDWDRVGGTKSAATAGNANGAGTPTTPPPAQTVPQTTAAASPQQTAPTEQAVTPGWGPPPPSTGGATPPANKAPWNN